MHNERPRPVTIDDRAAENLLEYCHAQGRERLLLVMDQNTRYRAG